MDSMTIDLKAHGVDKVPYRLSQAPHNQNRDDRITLALEIEMAHREKHPHLLLLIRLAIGDPLVVVHFLPLLNVRELHLHVVLQCPRRNPIIQRIQNKPGPLEESSSRLNLLLRLRQPNAEASLAGIVQTPQPLHLTLTKSMIGAQALDAQSRKLDQLVEVVSLSRKSP